MRSPAYQALGLACVDFAQGGSRLERIGTQNLEVDLRVSNPKGKLID
ncbi:hypothetical protein [Pontiella sulfatireligans]|nr:hypothetical protein [Pontiella sulfatireligans]